MTGVVNAVAFVLDASVTAAWLLPDVREKSTSEVQERGKLQNDRGTDQAALAHEEAFLNGCRKSGQTRRGARLEFADTQEPDVDGREMAVTPIRYSKARETGVASCLGCEIPR